MYNIKYSQEAFLSIDNFINSYKNYFIKLYSDTWIDDEEIIIKNYIDIWDRIYNNIKFKIEEYLKLENILWVHLDEYKNKYLVLILDNIRIFLYYSENLNLRERYIENIIFYKR